jgi:NAD-dependent deacetylase
MRPSSIVVLTGAGISAESGVATFRDADGLWSRIDYRDVATPEGFARDPDRVHAFYNMRRKRIREVEPNAAHHALAELERRFPGDFLLVTQNVDTLHEKAGSANILHMHGRHDSSLCAGCGDRRPWQEDLSTNHSCPACGVAGFMRPDVVWFGEMPRHMDEIRAALAGCSLFISIGTSGRVYPAANFVRDARRAGAHTVELNLEPSKAAALFAEAIHGRATEVVPAFVARLLGT